MAGTEATAPPTIRPLVAADVAWTRNLWRERWGAEVLALRGKIYDMTVLDGFVAKRDGQPVGVVTYLITGNVGEIMSLDAIERVGGIGTALVDRVKAEAARRGCRSLTVTTTNDNLDALRFYQRRGFRLERVDPGAVDRARQLKPQIPLVGDHGIPIRDEIRLTMSLTGSNAESET
jgi:GNAT superfamily N-acetyltransferase